jgi:ribonuclease BN (tRNA processing enzyme)
MRLQFVGCGDALGSGGRYNTCFHVQGDRVNFLIDCGASSLPALKRLGIARDAIDLILITHFHGDHFAGLPFLLLDAQFSRRGRPLVIAGPQGIEQKLPQVMEALFEHSSRTKRKFELSVVALKPKETRSFGAVKVTPYPVVHGESGGPFLGYRIEAEGRVIAYSRHRMDGDADPAGARGRPVHRRSVLLRQDRQEPSQPDHARGPSARDQAEAAGPDAYERGHAGTAGCAQAYRSA